MQEKIISRLKSLSEPDYQKFNASLIPGVDNILGIRLPYLRQIAKEISKGDWRSFLAESKINNDLYMEQTLIHGMVIGLIKADISEVLIHTTAFLPKINNWAVCDTFCCGLKVADKHPQVFWDYLQQYFKDDREYYLRFVVVMMLSHFISDEYIDRVLDFLNTIRHEGYYLKMAVAWAVSVCFIKYQTNTYELLLNNQLDDFTYNKSVQKICESNRVDQQTKALIRKLKR